MIGDIQLEAPLPVDRDLWFTSYDQDIHWLLSPDGAAAMEVSDADITFVDVGLDGDGTGGGVLTSGTVTLTDAQIQNCVGERGAAIRNEGDLTLAGCRITACSATADGGAIANYGTLEIKASELSGNEATGSGGAIYNQGELTVTDSQVTDNEANIDGGGVYHSSNSAAFRFVSGEMRDNTAGRNGGGIYTQYLERVSVGASASFDGNSAVSAYYMNTPELQALHEAHIQCSQFTGGFSYGYNNYDIGYPDGPLIPPVAALEFEYVPYFAGVPASGESSIQVLAKAYDSSGNRIPEAVITYALETPSPGVAVDSRTGVVTVTPAATAGVVVLVAQSGNTSVRGFLELLSVTIAFEQEAYKTGLPRDAETAVTVKAVVYDGNGQETDHKVTYELETANAFVRVDLDTGRVTIQPGAQEGDVTVIARFGGLEAKATVKLRQISRVEFEQTDYWLAIPGTGTNAITLKAIAYDRDGEVIEDAVFVYGLDSVPTGVGITTSTGVVTVTPQATDGTMMTTAIAVINGMTARANLYLYTFGSFAFEQDVYTVILPDNGTETVSVKAVLKNATGQALDVPVTYALENPAQGVEIDPDSGVVTVSSDAQEGSLMVTAYYNGLSATATLRLQYENFSFKIYGSSYTIRADLIGSPIHIYTVDWGDGTVDTDISHTYAQEGEYVITILDYESGWFHFENDKNLTEVLTPLPKQRGRISFASCFYGAENLISFPEDLFIHNPDATNFDNCFRGCAALTAIPGNLFIHNSHASNFDSCFRDCKALESIPETLFAANPKATTFYSCFSGNISLTSIPENLFANQPEVTAFNRCFLGCKALESIPENLFATSPKVTTFEQCFSYCSGLKNIPSGLFARCPEATRFGHCFSYCTALESLPDGLFAGNPKMQDVKYIFGYCPSLKYLPEDLFANNPEIYYFDYSFIECSSLVEIPEALFANNTNALGFHYCFGKAASLTSIPENLFANNTKVTSFNKTFLNCENLTGIPANLFANNPNVRDFQQCFDRCYSVTGLAPELWVTHPNSEGKLCFYSCTRLSNFSSIPGNWR